MNFISVVIYSYCTVALLLIALFLRDMRRETFFRRHQVLTTGIIAVLGIGIITALYAHLIEPRRLVVTTATITFPIKQPIRVGLIADIQVGNHKKDEWVNKIIAKARQEKPDIILIAGDLISNELGDSFDETIYLEPLQKLLPDFPVYAVLGNHDYGIGNREGLTFKGISADKHQLVIDRFKKLGIPLLRNELVCPIIRSQEFCVFGTDDIWGSDTDYARLNTWDTTKPIILLSHNPDTILSWPNNIPKPNLMLAGHTHGGQVYIPLYGPLGNAGIDLGKQYYRWLNYWQGIPIFVTVGAGESIGALRLFTPPEIAVITLTP